MQFALKNVTSLTIWEITVRDSGALTELLQSRLKKLEKPANYSSLRKRLIDIKPTRKLPIIEESPENVQPIEETKAADS